MAYGWVVGAPTPAPTPELVAAPTPAPTPARTPAAYELVYDDGECLSSDKRLDSSDGEFTVDDCAAACAADSDGCGYFGYRPGANSQCYAEYPSNPTAENRYCGEGFDSDPFDFYRLITTGSSTPSPTGSYQ